MSEEPREEPLSQRLAALGFDPMRDCVLQNDSDGAGDYIREWRSVQPCPFPELLREQNAPE